MKKFLSLVLALVMTMSLVTISAGAKDFTDDSKIQYKEAIDVVSTIGIVDGYADGSFNPSATLTRGAAAKIICNLLLGPTTASALVADAAPYSDVPVNSTFAGYIAYCQKQGIISGYADGTFKPGNTLTGYAFMKMLLGALGYEAANEGYTGANWSINVAKQALGIGLDSGLVDDFNGIKAVTREEACLYAFNMLKADMVEYDKSNTIVVNGTTISSGATVAKAVKSTNSSAANGNIGKGTTKDDYIQFAEQYFNKLVEKSDGDAFMRPATTWTYKGVKIGTYAETADKTYYKDVKLNAIYADLGMTSAAAKTYLYVNGVGGDVTAVQNVARANDTKLSKVNAGSAVVGDGTIVEAFLNTNTNEVTICAMSVYGGKVTDVKDETAKRDAYVVVTPGTTNAAGLTTANNTFETTDFAEDDVVAFTFSNKVGSTGIKDMYKMESVEGTLTKRVVGKSVQIGEETIGYAKNYDFDTINEGLLANKSSYVVYKDSQGNALWIEESKFGVDAYAYVDAITSTGDGLGANRARLVLSDGTKKTVDLDKDYYNNGVSPIVKAKDLVRFSENKDNTYKLVKINGTASGKSDASFTIDPSKNVSLGAAVDSETIFVIRKAGKTGFSVYTGIKNAPRVTAATTATAEAYVRNGVAKVVFVDNATVLNSSKEVTFVATSSVSKVNTSTNDGVNYYVYNAVVNGEITTVSVKQGYTMVGGNSDSISVASGADKASNGYTGLIFNSVTFDSTDDTIIDSTSFTGPASVYYATGVKKSTDSTIKLANSLKDVSAKCAVYEVDDGGDIEAIEFADIKTNSAAKAVYTMEDGEITNLFIILPKD